jgi:hypothetical protein
LRLNSKALIIIDDLNVRFSLVVTILQDNVPNPTLATEMEVDPQGVLDPWIPER